MVGRREPWDQAAVPLPVGLAVYLHNASPVPHACPAWLLPSDSPTSGPAPVPEGPVGSGSSEEPDQTLPISHRRTLGLRKERGRHKVTQSVSDWMAPSRPDSRELPFGTRSSRTFNLVISFFLAAKFPYMKYNLQMGRLRSRKGLRSHQVQLKERGAV